MIPAGKFAPFGICRDRPGHCFLAEAVRTAVDTCMASNYVKLPPPLISYRHCYPVNPFGLQSHKDKARGNRSSALGQADKKIPPGEKQPGGGFPWVGLCETPSPVWDPLAPSAGHGDAPGDTGVLGACRAFPGESEAGTKVARPCSKQWVCIAWAFGATARGCNPGLKRSINRATQIIWAPVNSLL